MVSSQVTAAPQTLLSAEEMVEAETVPVVLPVGPNAEVALASELVQVLKEVSESRSVRKDVQLDEMPLGMSGLAYEEKISIVQITTRNGE